MQTVTTWCGGGGGGALYEYINTKGSACAEAVYWAALSGRTATACCHGERTEAAGDRLRPQLVQIGQICRANL